MIGQTLNHYRIIDKLGEGGMAEVYLAEDLRLSRKVALKVLPKETAEDPDRIQRFEREAKAIAALNHPNIVTIYSVEEADGLRFLTMELIDGKALNDLIPEGGLELDEFFEIALPLMDAVAAAHRRGITHRDIKPANVMLNSEGVVKLLDLGLAKLEPNATADSGESSIATLTREGRVIGTVPYMAPEQLAGRKIDYRVDIFALGVVLYEMITGRRPFVATSSAELISAILRDTPKQVTEINEKLPNTLNHTIRRCLEKRPEHRFQSVSDLRAALDAAATGRATRKPKGEGGDTLRLPRPRSRSINKQWLVGAGVTIAVAVVATTLFGLLSGGDDTPGEGLASPPVRSVVLGPLEEISPPPGSALSPDLERELRQFLGDVDGLGLREGPAEAATVEGVATSDPAADYRLDSSIDWTGLPGAERVDVGFELVRLADGSVIWSETFQPAKPTAPETMGDIAATVRTRVGTLLGLQVPPAPTIEPVVDLAAAAPPPQSRTAPPPAPQRRAESTAAATQVPVVEEPAAPQEIVAEQAAVQLHLSLSSSQSAGVITVYAGAEQIYRRDFEFSERKGGVLGRVGMKKKVAGELEDAMLVPADTTELRVYVAIAKQPARQFALTPAFRVDGTDRLRINIRKKKDIDVTLE